MDADKIGKDADELHAQIYGDDDDEEDDEGIDNNPDEGDFKHKYEVLQGKYNAEIGRMGELLTSALLEKERLAAELEKKDPQLADLGDEGNFDDEIEEIKSSYPTLFKGMNAIIKKELSKVASVPPERIASIEATVGKVSDETYRKAMREKLPGWEKINVDPNFLKWLEQPDRYTGIKKIDLLRGAYASKNVDTSVAFFEDYLSTNPTKQDKGAEDDISPDTSGGPAPTPKTGTILRADINKFYKDRARGTWQGTEEQASAYEAKIMKAVREGKVR